jgi:hypothetical protein
MWGRPVRPSGWQKRSTRASPVGTDMQEEGLLTALEGLAEQLQIPVTYAALATEDLAGRGGLCIVHGERRIIIEQTLTSREKARLLAGGLAHLDFEGVFLLPVVREAIERARSSAGPP